MDLTLPPPRSPTLRESQGENSVSSRSPRSPRSEESSEISGRRRRISLREILSDDQRRGAFLEFLEENGEASVKFLMAVEAYESEEDEALRRELGGLIFKAFVLPKYPQLLPPLLLFSFLKISSPQSVDFDPWMRERIRKEIAESGYTPSLFDFSKSCVYKVPFFFFGRDFPPTLTS